MDVYEVSSALVVLLVVIGSTAGAAGVAADTGTSTDEPALENTYDDWSNADANLTEGGVYYAGSNLYRAEGIAANDEIDVVSVDNGDYMFQELVFSDNDGEVVFETGDLETGKYALRNSSGMIVVEFKIVKQFLDLEWNRSKADNEGDYTAGELSVDSNRAEYPMYLQATAGSTSISGDRLQEVFQGAGRPADIDDDGTNETLVVGGTNVATFSTDFEGLPAGEFNLTATVPDTGASTSAMIEVGTIDLDVDPSYADAAIEDGGAYYQSQLLYRTDGVSGGQEFELRNVTDGADVSEQMVLADYDGEIAVDTSYLGPGRYELRAEDGSTFLEFFLVEQEVNFLTETDTVTNGPTDSTMNLSVESNRKSYTLYVTATRDGGVVGANTIASILGDRGSPTDRNGDGLTETLVVDANNSLSFVADFEGVESGSYELTATAADTGASEGTTIEVTERGGDGGDGDDGSDDGDGDDGSDDGDGDDGSDGGTGDDGDDGSDDGQDRPGDARIVDGSTYYPGMELTRNQDISLYEQLYLVRLSDDRTKILDLLTADASGVVSVETDGFQPGEYALRDTDDNIVVTFEIGTGVEQSETDALLRADRAYYRPQVLFRQRSLAPKTPLELVNATGDEETVERVVVADPDGDLAIETRDLTVGQYRLRWANGSEFLRFAVTDQTIDLTADPESVTNGATDSTVNVTVASTRSFFQMNLEATRDGTLVTAETLTRILELDDVSTWDSDGDGQADTLVAERSGNGTFTADFEGVEPGTYELTVTAIDTPQSTTTTVEVLDAEKSGESEQSPVVDALEGDDDEVQFGEVRDAIDYFNSGDVVPGTNGETASFEDVIAMIKTFNEGD